jgi:hypothetical protein
MYTHIYYNTDIVATPNFGPNVMLTEVGNNSTNYWAATYIQNVSANIYCHGIDFFG